MPALSQAICDRAPFCLESNHSRWFSARLAIASLTYAQAPVYENHFSCVKGIEPGIEHWRPMTIVSSHAA
jgi:hypothetical protein